MSGVISGDGGFKKVGDGTTSFLVITPIPVLLRLKGTLKVTGSLLVTLRLSLSLRVPPMKLPTVMRLVRFLVLEAL